MNARSNSRYSLEAEFHRTLRRRSSYGEIATLSSHQPKTRLQKWAQALLDFVTGTQSLSIRQCTNKQGTSQWIVYEPTSDTRRIFNSEHDVRVWLEKRHP